MTYCNELFIMKIFIMPPERAIFKPLRIGATILHISKEKEKKELRLKRPIFTPRQVSVIHEGLTVYEQGILFLTREDTFLTFFLVSYSSQFK